MFKILIADDERIIRQGIISILRRELQEEMEFHEASNGMEALQKAKKENPNLIITDIRMPGCSGLEFIQQLSVINNKVTVIILSGYENFEYAKEAMKYGVKEYITKPFKKQEFLELIKGYVNGIIQEEDRDKENIVKSLGNKRVISNMKSEVLINLLNSENSSEARIYYNKMKSLGINFNSSLLVCAVIQYEINPANEDYIDFALQNILDEYLHAEGRQKNIYSVNYTLGSIAVIYEGNEQNSGKKQLIHLLQRVSKLVEEYYKLKVFIGLGDVVHDPYHLHQSMAHALLAASSKIYETGEELVDYDLLPNGPEYKPIEIERLLKPLEEANAILVANAFDPILKEKKSKSAIMTIQKAYEQFRSSIYSRVSYLEYINEEQLPKVKEFHSLWSFATMKREIRDVLENLQEARERSGKDIHSIRILNQVLLYINDHITEELDLNTVAEHFSRTPGYISTLFNKSVDIGFNNYITNERIKIAKRLLEDSSIPIQEVGQLCGYPNSKYFSVVFKKVTGESPSNYRDKNI